MIDPFPVNSSGVFSLLVTNVKYPKSVEKAKNLVKNIYERVLNMKNSDTWPLLHLKSSFCLSNVNWSILTRIHQSPTSIFIMTSHTSLYNRTFLDLQIRGSRRPIVREMKNAIKNRYGRHDALLLTHKKSSKCVNYSIRLQIFRSSLWFLLDAAIHWNWIVRISVTLATRDFWPFRSNSSIWWESEEKHGQTDFSVPVAQ